MQEAERKHIKNAQERLEAFYAVLSHDQRPEVPVDQCKLIEREAERLEAVVPGHMPPVDPNYFRGPWDPSFQLYVRARVKIWLAAAIERLQDALDANSADPLEAPLRSAPDFHFVTNADLRKILRRDFGEIERAMAQSCWKSAIILSGGIVEALLLDAVTRAAPTPAKPTFYELIKKAQDLRLVGKAVNRLTDTLREYRNLVHVAVEMQQALRVDEHEARLALAILCMVERDLAELPR